MGKEARTSKLALLDQIKNLDAKGDALGLEGGEWIF